MLLFEDHLGRSLSFDSRPSRIISLVPSQTELLVDLGLRQNILGITKFCVHPPLLRKEKTIVGGTKKVNIEKIRSLSPDIILCNKEENTKEMVEILSEIAPVHVTDIKTTEDSLRLITDYGFIFDKQDRAHSIVQKVLEERKKCIDVSRVQNRSVAYIIWQNPLMVAGNNTFINSLLKEIGFVNAFKNKTERYPEIDIKELENIDEVFLSSEPYPFTDVHRKELNKHTGARVTLVNGEYFSWYGSRLIIAYPYFKRLLLDLKL